MSEFSDEVLNLVSLDYWRKEAPEIVNLRESYGRVMKHLCNGRDQAWRSEAWRNYSIAITELENSCMRAIKAMYSI